VISFRVEEVSEDGALFDARFDDGGPFRDTPEAGGISLESALRDFGPAAIDDLIPRVRILANRLDAAHRTGAAHGALHPNCIYVTDTSTSLTKGTGSSAPYLAPEVVDGERPTPASDQYALAAIAYEWLFGRRINGPARRAVDVKTMPGIDRVALSKAFTRALAPDPDDRFDSCGEFCDAFAAASSLELPLGANTVAGAAGDEFDEHDPVGPFIPENPSDNGDKVVAVEASLPAEPFDSDRESAFIAEDARPEYDAIDQLAPAAEPSPVASWNPSAARVSDPARFSGMALIVAALVGSAFGFAGGYLARPRALQSGPAETFASQPGTENAVGTAAKPAETAPETTAPPRASGPPPAAVPAPTAPQSAEPPARVGRLLVRSNPSGATVSVDGVEKGVTPLALGDVEYGTRTVTVERTGYVTERRRVALSGSRPSRSMDVRLTAQASASRPRPATPASLGKPAVTTGGLSVDSRPTGAAVSINGKAIGTTPLTINDLPPGEYRVVMTLAGFQNFTTTVRVVAGERVRAAASLTAQEQE
jgi:hypothetical protein